MTGKRCSQAGVAGAVLLVSILGKAAPAQASASGPQTPQISASAFQSEAESKKHGKDMTADWLRIDNWAQIPNGEKWGVMSDVDIDRNGNIYVLWRNPSRIQVFDKDGKFLRAWGEGQYEYAHSLRITPDQRIWVTDRKGQQAFKYDLNGNLLMTLGKKDVVGDMTSTDTFNGISDVVVGDHGDLFVTDGEDGNTRVLKFTKNGKFIKMWGTKGSDPGEFRMPHEAALDPKGRLWVCDRSNKRIAIYDQDGNLLETMPQFGAASGISIAKDGRVFVADTPPDSDIIFATLDGQIEGWISGLRLGHGVVPDAHGNVYLADGGANVISKYVHKKYARYARPGGSNLRL
jgi:hypothetical protein